MSKAFELTNRDKQRLRGVHPDLVRWVKLAAQGGAPVKFCVLEGLRTKERQQELVAQRKSLTMNSRHITGHAVDLAPIEVLGGKEVISWRWPLYHLLAEYLKDLADEMGLEIEWGGDWKKFPDGPHWQLPYSVTTNPDIPKGNV